MEGAENSPENRRLAELVSSYRIEDTAVYTQRFHTLGDLIGLQEAPFENWEVSRIALQA